MSIELSGTGERVFIPRPTLAVGEIEGANGQMIDEIVFSGEPTLQNLGFVEEGSASNLFIPLAIVDDSGIVTSDKVIWPVSLSWESPVNGRQTELQLNWFSPRDQWQLYDGILWAQ